MMGCLEPCRLARRCLVIARRLYRMCTVLRRLALNTGRRLSRTLRNMLILLHSVLLLAYAVYLSLPLLNEVCGNLHHFSIVLVTTFLFTIALDKLSEGNRRESFDLGSSPRICVVGAEEGVEASVLLQRDN